MHFLQQFKVCGLLPQIDLLERGITKCLCSREDFQSLVAEIVVTAKLDVVLQEQKQSSISASDNVSYNIRLSDSYFPLIGQVQWNRKEFALPHTTLDDVLKLLRPSDKRRNMPLWKLPLDWQSGMAAQALTNR